MMTKQSIICFGLMTNPSYLSIARGHCQMPMAGFPMIMKFASINDHFHVCPRSGKQKGVVNVYPG